MFKKFFMKTRVILYAAFSLIFVKVNANCLDKDDISAKSAILICADSGSIIFGKNEKEPLPMASTTKIMTSILAIENLQTYGNKEVEITDDMVKVEGTSMGLAAGNIVNIDTLVQGMLLCSGNDAANAVAMAISGNLDNFVYLMNEKAHMIGMKDTKFSTPSGLDKDNHHSTAEDMAILGAYAMENEMFSSIASKKSMKVHFISPNKDVSIRNHNKLLRLYDGCIGVKTGFTKNAGRCLVSCAQRNGARLICVTLNAPNDWDDHIKMFNYGFENVSIKTLDDRDFSVSIPVKNSDVSNVVAKCELATDVCLKNDDIDKVEREVKVLEFAELPIEKGQILGNVVYSLNGKIIAENPIISTQTLDMPKKQEAKGIFQKIAEFFGRLFHF